jgi:hypothetical protein
MAAPQTRETILAAERLHIIYITIDAVMILLFMMDAILSNNNTMDDMIVGDAVDD